MIPKMLLFYLVWFCFFMLCFDIFKSNIYTGWAILIHPVEYLDNQARERKIFQIKVVWFRRDHKMVPLV